MAQRHDLKVLSQDDLMRSVAVVVGTRPGIIKMSPLIRELGRRDLEHFVIHTGQHYSPEMDDVFFRDLGLAPPRYRLDRVKDCYFHGEQTAEMIRGVERVLLEGRPMVVLVCGDANTNLAAGLAARKLRMVVGHVESGLRSGDWSMPEEHNRIILDHTCELLFAPTEEACRNLTADHVRGEIHLTGNTVVDALFDNLEIARRRSGVLGRLGLQRGEYIICTVHREENVDSRQRLEAALAGIARVAAEVPLPLVLPLHPRTRNRLREFGLEGALDVGSGDLRVVEPFGYLDFLMLVEGAKVVMTDSGGLQEESCILQVPCVTLRDNTERPETVQVGANRIVGVDPQGIVDGVKHMADAPKGWPNPFGDGHAARRIVDVVERVLSEGVRLDQPPVGLEP